MTRACNLGRAPGSGSTPFALPEHSRPDSQAKVVLDAFGRAEKGSEAVRGIYAPCRRWSAPYEALQKGCNTEAWGCGRAADEGAKDVRVNFRTVRPADYSTPYETLLKNQVHFAAVDKGSNRLLNLMVRPPPLVGRSHTRGDRPRVAGQSSSNVLPCSMHHTAVCFEVCATVRGPLLLVHVWLPHVVIGEPVC